MQVKDVMTKGAEVVRPDATLQEAANKMKSLDIGPLPVCDGDKIIGMLTDRDITVRATAEGLDPKQTRVREVMSKELITCLEDQDVKEAAELMQSKQIRRVPVLSRDKRLVGMLSLGDLAQRTQDSGKPPKRASAATIFGRPTLWASGKCEVWGGRCATRIQQTIGCRTIGSRCMKWETSPGSSQFSSWTCGSTRICWTTSHRNA